MIFQPFSAIGVVGFGCTAFDFFKFVLKFLIKRVFSDCFSIRRDGSIPIFFGDHFFGVLELRCRAGSEEKSQKAQCKHSICQEPLMAKMFHELVGANRN